MTAQARPQEKPDPKMNRILAALEQPDYDALMLDA
jgi:hypothetical protein